MDQPESAPELSALIPLKDEAANIAPLLATLKPVLAACCSSFEIIFVDDGSRDGTLEALRDAHAEDVRVKVMALSRNFGKEIAIAAGLDAARGKAVIILDADLQHPPSAIPAMVTLWRQGYENVFATRASRAEETRLKQFLTRRFYRMFEVLGETPLPAGAGDFRLLDRKAVMALRAMGERARFNKGLYSWIGFRSIGVPVTFGLRHSGRSKFSYRQLTRFAFDGLMSFSTLPLKVWTYVGTLISTGSVATALYFLARTMIFGADVPGFATLIVSVLFLAGVQLMSLGIMGEYVGRIFAEVKGRPLYLVSERLGLESDALRGPLPPLPTPMN